MNTIKNDFEAKTFKYGAVERNFDILRKISKKQQDDFQKAMQHSVGMEKKAVHYEAEYLSTKEVLIQLQADHTALKKREADFEFALKERVEHLFKIDTLTQEFDQLFF